MTASGIFEFDEQFTWRDENGGGHDQTELGTWAGRTWSYKAYQYNGLGNVVDVSTPGYYVEYSFLIPVDQSALSDITVEVVSRGIVARATNDPDSWYLQNSLFISGSSFETKSASIPMVSWDTTVPGQVKFYLVFENNNNGGVDSFHVTATATGTIVDNPTIIDFESPTYTVDTLINGQDGWTGPSDMVQIKYDSGSERQVLDFSDAVGYTHYASRNFNTTYSTGKVRIEFLMKWLWDLSGEIILKDSSNNWVFSFGIGKNYLQPGLYWQIGEGPAGYVVNANLPPTIGDKEFIQIRIDIDLDENLADVSWGEIGQPKTVIFTDYALNSTSSISKIDLGNSQSAAQFDDLFIGLPYEDIIPSTFINFEPPAYTVDLPVDGQDGWIETSNNAYIRQNVDLSSQVLDFTDAVGSWCYASRTIPTYSEGKVKIDFLMKWLWDLSGEIILKDSSNNWVFSFGIGKNYLQPGLYWQIGEGPAGYVVDANLPPTVGNKEFIEIRIEIDLDTNLADVSWGEKGQAKTVIFTDYALNSTATISKIDIGNSQAAAMFDDIRVNFNTCSDLLDDNILLSGDINSDCRVNLDDLDVLASQWLKCTDPNLSGCEHAIGSVNTLKIAQTQQPIIVDGNLSDWPIESEWVWLDKVYTGTVSDIQEAKFSARWSSSTNKVYLAVVVNDADPQLEDIPTDWNTSDRIEVYSQGSAAGGTGWGANGMFDVAQQYIVGPKLSGGKWARWGSLAAIGSDAGFEYALTSNGNETIYEIAVTQFSYYAGIRGGTTIPLTLTAGMTIGFDVAADSRTAAGQFGMLTENMMTGKWNDANQFQHYTLVSTLPLQTCGEWGYIDEDLNLDCSVNLLDFAEVAQSWMLCNDPADENCLDGI